MGGIHGAIEDGVYVLISFRSAQEFPYWATFTHWSVLTEVVVDGMFLKEVGDYRLVAMYFGRRFATCVYYFE